MDSTSLLSEFYVVDVREENEGQDSILTAKLPLSQYLAPLCVFQVASGLFHLLGLIFTQFWNFTRGGNTKEGTSSKTSNIVTGERHPQAVNPYST